MTKEYTCIACPRGCGIEALIEDGKVVSAEGAACAKGLKFVEQELTDPRRNIATSVLVLNGAAPLVSVRLTNAIPKAMIFPVLEEIKKINLTAPIFIGQAVIENVLGLGCDVIATKPVPKDES